MIDAALINEESGIISIHRLVQTSFLHQMKHEDLQRCIHACSVVLNGLFPKQVGGRPFVGQWEECEKYAQHTLSLCDRYNTFRSSCNLAASDDLIELLCNCAWFLHETGEWDGCRLVLELGFSCCSDKEGLRYSHLLNTAGARCFELNQIPRCKHYWEEALKIRKLLLATDDEDLLCTKNNLGNAKSAENEYDEAIKLFEEVGKVRETLGKGAIVSLAISYAGSARAYRLKGEFDNAISLWDRVMEILVSEYGTKGHFVAQ